jgi:ubiquinol-cytochrome c reductase iron-sulfur subunit
MTVNDDPHAGKHAAEDDLDLDDPRLSRWDIVQEGARLDGVEIVHYEPPFPVPGTRAERRIERIVMLLFLLTGLAATAFVLVYILWPWEYERGATASKLYTPLLGLTLALTFFGVGFGIMTWGKKLIPHEVSIQDRHEGGSTRQDRVTTGTTLVYMGDELGVKRRPLLGLTLLAGLAPVGAAITAPIVGGLIEDPHKPGPDGRSPLTSTAWNTGVRLVRHDGTPIRPEDVSAGGQMTVFPDVPGGTTNEHADSPTLLIHLRAEDAAELHRKVADLAATGKKAIQVDDVWGNFVAYSKICTHAGCPASLYEQRTNRLLCPCHQSQFLITACAMPIFGPATRRLPMLPIEVDADGFFVAKSDYRVPIGPAFWERP